MTTEEFKKLKEGDRVRLKSLEELTRVFGKTEDGIIKTKQEIFTETSMGKYLGKIVKVIEKSNYCIAVNDVYGIHKAMPWWFSYDAIEEIIPADYEINKFKDLKEGDKVRLKTLEELKLEFSTDEDGDIRTRDSFVGSMYKAGKIVTVSEISNFNSFTIEEDQNSYIYDLECISEVLPSEEKKYKEIQEIESKAPFKITLPYGIELFEDKALKNNEVQVIYKNGLKPIFTLKGYIDKIYCMDTKYNKAIKVVSVFYDADRQIFNLADDIKSITVNRIHNFIRFTD